MDASSYSEAVKELAIPSRDLPDSTLQVPLSPVFLVDVTANPVAPVPNKQPKLWKSAAATTVAATDIWTPTAGKRFRLMGISIDPSAGLAAAGAEVITIIEETLGSFGIVITTYLPIAASVAHQVPITMDFGDGYLATLPDKKLQVTLSAAATAGAISITAWGMEE